MIFKPELVEKILAGEKTQTRRPVKWDRDGRVPCRYKVGRTYAVQPGRGEKGVARIRVTGVRRERWIDITEVDALAEGFRPSSHAPAYAHFRAYVKDLYPELDLESECWVIEFELVAREEKGER